MCLARPRPPGIAAPVQPNLHRGRLIEYGLLQQALGALHSQCAGACRQERPACRLRFHRYGIFPTDEAVIRLVGALLLEQNDEWAIQRSRYMTPETIATISDDPLISQPEVAH